MQSAFTNVDIHDEAWKRGSRGQWEWNTNWDYVLMDTALQQTIICV